MKNPKLIQKDEHVFVFKFPDGSISENFFWADEFDNGFAIVSKTRDGGFQYLDRRGNLSEEFDAAFGYSDGFGLVRIDDDHGPQFRDIDGNLSEEFYRASNYKEGFAAVKRSASSPVELRDVLGHLSKEKTYLGIMAYLYRTHQISCYELTDACYLDNDFFRLILKTEYACSKLALKGADEQEIKEGIFEAIDYVVTRKASAAAERGAEPNLKDL